MKGEQTIWETTPLRSLCLETTTIDPTKTPDKVFEYVDVSAVSNELWKIMSSTRHTGATAPGRARKLVRAQDVIFATVRPSLKRIALVRQNLDEQVVSTAFCVLRADPIKADPSFIYYSLLTEDFVNQVSNLERGASYPAVTDKDVLEQEIVVPPLPEQRAIAAVLSRIQAAVEVQEKIVGTLKELKATTMARLFREGLRGEPLKQTEIGEIPESWEVVRMGGICEKINYGTSVRCSSERNGRPVLRIPNIVNETVDTSDLKWATLPEREVSKLLLEQGDLVFVRTNGNKQYTGRCAVYQGKPEGALFASYLIRVRLSKERILPDFAQAYLSSIGREQITSKAHPASDGKYNIDTGVLRDVLLPRSSLTEQQSIIAIIETISRRLETAREEAQRLKSVFSSMLHLLMTGRVRLKNLTSAQKDYPVGVT